MARSRYPVAVYSGQFRNVKGVAALQRRIASIPDGVVASTKGPLIKAADQLVARIRPTVPTSKLEDQDGPRLRDSVRREPGDHELAVVVVEDGQDQDGKPIAKHVEHGHRAVDGSHVEALPHFWPSYQVEKRKIRSRVGRGMTAGAKAAFAKPQGGENQ